MNWQGNKERYKESGEDEVRDLLEPFQKFSKHELAAKKI
jgi:hypothetical protein